MSHFAVAVFTTSNRPSIEALMKPYQEEADEEYLTFHDLESEELANYQNKSGTFVKSPDGQYFYENDPVFQRDNETRKPIYPEGFVKIEVPFKERYKTFDEYMEEWCGFDERDEKTNRYGYWHNQNAKWDWYEVGGRFSGKLLLKPGATGTNGNKSWYNEKIKIPSNRVDSALVSDIDFSMDEKTYKQAILFWELFVDERKPLNEEEKKFAENRFAFKKEYYLQRYGNKETYVKDCATFSTFAIVTPSGEWLEKGTMGWWGCSNESDKDALLWTENYSKFLEKYKDCYITILDCHI